MTIPFGPQLGETVSVSATASTASAAISINRASTLVVSNTGSSLAYVSWGAGSATATTSDYPVLSGSKEPVTIPNTVTHVAAICDSGESTTVKFTPGRGI